VPESYETPLRRILNTPSLDYEKQVEFLGQASVHLRSPLERDTVVKMLAELRDRPETAYTVRNQILEMLERDPSQEDRAAIQDEDRPVLQGAPKPAKKERSLSSRFTVVSAHEGALSTFELSDASAKPLRLTYRATYPQGYVLSHLDNVKEKRLYPTSMRTLDDDHRDEIFSGFIENKLTSLRFELVVRRDRDRKVVGKVLTVAGELVYDDGP